jgi:hypothetical protein
MQDFRFHASSPFMLNVSLTPTIAKASRNHSPIKAKKGAGLFVGNTAERYRHMPALNY